MYVGILVLQDDKINLYFYIIRCIIFRGFQLNHAILYSFLLAIYRSISTLAHRFSATQVSFKQDTRNNYAFPVIEHSSWVFVAFIMFTWELFHRPRFSRSSAEMPSLMASFTISQSLLMVLLDWMPVSLTGMSSKYFKCGMSFLTASL